MKSVLHSFRPVVILGVLALAATLALLFAGPLAVRPVDAALCMSLNRAVLFESLIQTDGRINQIAHFGGDALYCVDSAGNPTSNYGEMVAFRVLDANGQTLWSLPAATVLAGVTEAEANGQGQLIDTGAGSYGPAAISVIATDGLPTFEFAAYDEFGKLNTLQFQGCQPVGPAAPPDTTSTSSSSSGPAPQCFLVIDEGCGPIEYVEVKCEGQELCIPDGDDVNENGSETDYLCDGIN